MVRFWPEQDPNRGAGERLGLAIYTSNHLRILLDRLAETYRTSPRSPLEDEWLVVQSRGMARWLTLSLAEPLGISASFAFDLPKSFCFRMTDLVLEKDREKRLQQTLFADRQRLTWALFSTLPKLLHLGEFAPVSRYLKDDPNQLKCFQLASRVADCFDNYQLYRPDMLKRWSSGHSDPTHGEETWQRLWWREVMASTDDQPLHELIHEAMSALRNNNQPEKLPERLAIFGISSLPPLFLALIDCLAARMDVSIFVVNPTEHFWGDLPASAKSKWIGAQNSNSDFEDFGHDLLISLGRQGRDFFNLLQQMDVDGQAWRPLTFRVPPRDHLLHHLQADIAGLIRRGPGETEGAIAIETGDQSLQCHICHSPLREMEVLRDLILATFESMPDLRLHEILVMVPDITKYAPFIEATFGNADTPASYLPFSIADQSLSDTLPLIQAVLSLIEVVTGRMPAHAVFDLLEVPAIRRRFQIGDAELDELRRWIEATNIAWARDGKHRQTHFSLPKFEENSWRQGLDRMMLSYAMGDFTGMVGGMAPIGQATTSQAELLGHFTQFMTSMFQCQGPLGKPQTLAKWAEIFNDLLQTFFLAETEEEESALQSVRDRIAMFPEVAQQSQIDTELNLALVLEPMRQLLRQEGFGSGFINGKITFCAMKPMRTIPYKVVCMAGLNDGDFPRQDQPSSFDLMEKSRRPGDRSMREDDRYLFLEAILACESRLLLTYVGHHPEDMQPVPPSSVLQELLTHLDRAFHTGGGKPVSDQILIHHPAQPFDRRYFDDRYPDFFTYDPTRYASAMVHQTRERPPFLDQPLPKLDPQHSLQLSSLVQFWKHPSKYLCQEILGIRFTGQERPLNESEPLEVDGLLKYQLNQRIFESHAESVGDPLELRLKAEGLLPPGHLGKAHYTQCEQHAGNLVAISREKTYLEAQRFAVKVGDFTLEANFTDLTTEGRFVARAARINPSNMVEIWLHHLFFQVIPKSPVQGERITEIAGMTSRAVQHYRLLPVPDAEARLIELIESFISGQTQPLPLFGESSFCCAKDAFKADGHKLKAKFDIKDNWTPGEHVYNPGNCDPYFRLCFGHEPNFDFQPPEAHQRAAPSFWGPFFAAIEEVT